MNTPARCPTNLDSQPVVRCGERDTRGASGGQDSDMTKLDSRRRNPENPTPVLTLEDLTIKFGELFFHNEREIHIIEYGN